MDDDPVNQMVIQAMLGKAGFKVLKAADGQKALDLLEVGAAAGESKRVLLLWVLPLLGGGAGCCERHAWLSASGVAVMPCH